MKKSSNRSKRLKVAVYRRVGIWDQRGKGDLEHQQYQKNQIINDLRDGFPNRVIDFKFYTDEGSTLSPIRPDYARLCRDITDGKIDFLAVHSFDKLHRDWRAIVKFEEFLEEKNVSLWELGSKDQINLKNFPNHVLDSVFESRSAQLKMLRSAFWRSHESGFKGRHQS